jgi:hypothetical protein
MTRIVTFQGGERESYRDDALGSGAKGEVYISVDGQHVFKKFINETAAEQRRHRTNLEQVVGQYNVVQGRPYWSALFSCVLLSFVSYSWVASSSARAK